eukprot:3000059-Pyramimonas_sp.AAC.1
MRTVQDCFGSVRNCMAHCGCSGLCRNCIGMDGGCMGISWELCNLVYGLRITPGSKQEVRWAHLRVRFCSVAALRSRDTGSPAMAPLLHKWEASDIDTTTLEYNLGPVLRQIGIQTRARDIFELFQDPELVNEPLVIIIACIYPPNELMTLRLSPPAHTETLPRGVE